MVWVHPLVCPLSVSSSSSGFLRSRRFLSLKRSCNFTTEQPSFFCSASWQELAGVLLFSAIPFAAVKAIANSSIGESLRRKMEDTKKFAVENSSKFKAQAEEARKKRAKNIVEKKTKHWKEIGSSHLFVFDPRGVEAILGCKLSLLITIRLGDKVNVFLGGGRIVSLKKATNKKKELGILSFEKGLYKECFWYGEDRPYWLGPISYEYPSYLTGELPGDYGFDIAGLGKDPVALQKNFNFEILHSRWAMLASVGALIPEILDLSGAFHFVEPVWWRVGYSKLKGDTLDYLGIPGLHFAGSQGVVVIAVCQALLMLRYVSGDMCSIYDFRFAARYCGIEALEPLGIYLPGDINYPGGALFDPLNLSNDPEAFEELKVKEIKNGRLAMVAWLGFYVQAALTGKGPVQNLIDHISDPFHNNFLDSLNFMKAVM
ncbi:hypothetical protein Fmac_033041 [Flemingia macrophylla]|uniref:Chlorophyll a-b binding protein, chloroplastic n=1 Tax=Flemingia macrophylla TaxID=520843 RepID=A0ABD1L6M6_9FABA